MNVKGAVLRMRKVKGSRGDKYIKIYYYTAWKYYNEIHYSIYFNIRPMKRSCRKGSAEPFNRITKLVGS